MKSRIMAGVKGDASALPKGNRVRITVLKGPPEIPYGRH